MSTGTSAAAEAVLADIAEETLEQGEPAQQERAAEHLQNLGHQVEAPEEPPNPDPEDEAITLPEAAPEEWLDEPEYEEPEVVAEVDDDDEIYVEDEQLRREKALRIKAEKEAAHYKALRVKEARKNWVAEAKEHAPLAAKVFGEDFSGIKADSRKAFLKQAAETHNTLRTALEEIVAPEKARAYQEARAEAQVGFGKATSGPGAAPSEKAANRGELETMRDNKAPLNRRIRKLWDSGEVQI